MDRIRNAIIAQAVNDYKGLVDGSIRPKQDCNLEELEQFFKSEYCKNLLIDQPHITPKDILDYLHKWRKEYYDALEKGTAQVAPKRGRRKEITE